MTSENTASEIVNLMYSNDSFSKWLGIKIESIGLGNCRLSMKVKKEMLNGFGLAHGGITFSLADSALAFASNSHGRKAVSIDTQISHTSPVFENDELTAIASEINRSRNLARYTIEVLNQNKSLVAHFIGTVFIKNENWID